MGGRILVINPNSNETVTAGIDEAVAAQRESGVWEIDCITLTCAPFGIESAADIAEVVPMISAAISSRCESYDAFIIACYSDPGLEESRSLCEKPVFGIHESAARLAANAGLRFGVLALGEESIARHVDYIRKLKLESFHAGEKPLYLSVDEAAAGSGAFTRIVEEGKALLDDTGAGVLILGCAGMARHRAQAEQALGVPVIDPVQAAVTMARRELGS